MSDHPLSEPLKDSDGTLPDKRKRERHQRREERRTARKAWVGDVWVSGGVLILAGALLLLQNLGLFKFVNGYALAILIPAGNLFLSAWDLYQDAGRRLDKEASGPLFGGFAFTLVALILFFDINWIIVLPVLLVVFGVWLLLNAVLPD